MATYIGATDVTGLFVGSTRITAAYLGDEQVWPNIPNVRMPVAAVTVGGGDLDGQFVAVILETAGVTVGGADIETFAGGVAFLETATITVGAPDLTAQAQFTILDVAAVTVGAADLTAEPFTADDIILLGGDMQDTGTDGIALGGDEAGGVIRIGWPFAVLDLAAITVDAPDPESDELPAILLAGDEQSGGDVIVLGGDEAPGNLIARP